MSLFKPTSLGGSARLALGHRVVLAPLTRNRADAETLVPQAMCVEYYKQRASPGGLLISEATNISPESLAYPATPGIWNAAQVEGWRKVTDAVHEEGGLIFCQLWHTGRVAHDSYRLHPLGDPARAPSVSASSTQIVKQSGKPGKTLGYGDAGFVDYSVPRALRDDEISGRLLDDYRRAASNARAAGFDGVELHAAHGYLIDQFLNDGVNVRGAAESGYGGSIEKRCRLLFEAIDVLQTIWPPGRGRCERRERGKRGAICGAGLQQKCRKKLMLNQYDVLTISSPPLSLSLAHSCVSLEPARVLPLKQPESCYVLWLHGLEPRRSVHPRRGWLARQGSRLPLTYRTTLDRKIR